MEAGQGKRALGGLSQCAAWFPLVIEAWRKSLQRAGAKAPLVLSAAPGAGASAILADFSRGGSWARGEGQLLGDRLHEADIAACAAGKRP